MFATKERIEILKEIRKLKDSLETGRHGCMTILEEQRLAKTMEEFMDFLILDASGSKIDLEGDCNHVLVETEIEKASMFNCLLSQKKFNLIKRLYFCPNCLRRFVSFENEPGKVFDLIDFSKNLLYLSSLDGMQLKEPYSVMPVDGPIDVKNQEYFSLLYLRAYEVCADPSQMNTQMRKFYDEDEKKLRELNARMAKEYKQNCLGI